MPDETPAPTDHWHNFTEALRKLLDYERWAVILPVVVCAIALTVIVTACKPVSTLDGEKVTPDTLNSVYESKVAKLEQRQAAWMAEGEQIRIEAEALDTGYDTAIQDMERQATRTNEVLSAIGGIATSVIAGTVNPAGIIGTLVTLGASATAVGFGLSSKRKNGVITHLKTTGGTGA